MSMDVTPVRADVPELQGHFVRLLGTGAAAPTVVTGRGVTCTRTSAGLYKLTWSEDPGYYVGFSLGLEAATPADIAGHTLIADTYDSTAKTQEFLFSGASEVAHDLAANEYINLVIWFKRTGVT